MSVALSDHLDRLLASGDSAVLVTVAAAEGSTPRECGAAMLVTTGESHGTVGGGALEFHAIDVARAMLARGEESRELDMPLGPVLGQCCGGHVRLALERADAARLRQLKELERATRSGFPPVLVFGCGHTGLALARALAPLPLRVSVVDDRLDETMRLPGGIPLLRRDDPVDAVAAAAAGTAFVILTHSHALDYRLAEAALLRADAAYVGMIGSGTKRARFEGFFRRNGGDPVRLADLTCPIGGGEVTDKRPEVIAALTAAELLRRVRSPLAGEGGLRVSDGRMRGIARSSTDPSSVMASPCHLLPQGEKESAS